MLMALNWDRLNCDVVARSSMWRVPPAGRQARGRCSEVSGVTRALALTAGHRFQASRWQRK